MKFCFWGDIGSAIKGRTVGGAELQIALIAKEITRLGHEVVIVDPYIGSSFISEEGIKVISPSGWNKGIPVVKMFTTKFPKLYRLLVNEKADFYYIRMRSYLHLASYWAAKKNRARLIVHFASDVDLLSLRESFRMVYKRNFNLISYLTQWLPNELVFKFILRRSDFIICQHEGQLNHRSCLKGKKVLFPNLFASKNRTVPASEKKDYIVYAGAITMLKGADKLFELVSKIRKSQQVVIIGLPKDENAEKAYEKLKMLENTVLKGWEGHEEVIKLISHAKLLVNTSYLEGFPNVFLEAWSLGVPVYSLNVNPGNILEKYKLGQCFNGDLELMASHINQNREKEFNVLDMHDYMSRFHDLDSAGTRFLNVLGEV